VDSDADVLHGIEADLHRERARAAEAVGRCSALAELLSLADEKASGLNRTVLTPAQLWAVRDENERAELQALVDRAYQHLKESE